MTENIALSHHLAGRSVPGAASFVQKNPAAPDDLRIEGPEADAALVAEAVAAAREAVKEIESKGIEPRADALAYIGRRLSGDVERLALLIARETGKTIGDSKGEVLRAARIFDFFAGETLRNIGERFASTRPGATVEVDYVPVGVVAAITPWNFPIAIPAWKIAPALAFGNAVVWKPSEISSATAAALMDIIVESGLPAGSVNMLLGAGGAGKVLVESPDIDAISFTGSVATGKHVRLAAAERAVRVQLEMGGVNGLIVLADADLDNAVDCAINGAFFGAGQRCTATSRFIVDQTVADRFLDKLMSKVSALKVGNPCDPANHIGPLATPRQKGLISQQVEKVEASGLTPIFGGSDSGLKHCFYAPTLFDDVPLDSTLVHDEIFGPVAGLFRVDGFDTAIDVLNRNRFGLSAGICTGSLAHVEAFKRRARAGMLMINLPTAGVDYHAPFGGVAASSHGPREQGRAARSFYTNLKTSYQKPL